MKNRLGHLQMRFSCLFCCLPRFAAGSHHCSAQEDPLQVAPGDRECGDAEEDGAREAQQPHDGQCQSVKPCCGGEDAEAADKRTKYYERFYASSFAIDQVDGDITAGEDPIVRAAAIDALGNMNGTVVSIDPDSGRILAMVNQKLALSAGAQPCSTIKVAVALAALSENVITKDTEIPLGKY